MRILTALAAAALVCAASPRVSAHGPQIQITRTGDKIVPRALYLEAPYVESTAPKSAYVIPVLLTSGVWYASPNSAINPTTLTQLYPSGPGLAYGSDLADGGPQDFATGSVISLAFADGLKRWNGAAFVDAGATQLKVFRGSNENISTPPENFAVSSDTGPFDSLSLAAVAADYGTEGAGVHGSFRYAFLGDGISPALAPSNGVYLAKLQLSTTQSGIHPSDPFFVVLHKNASSTDIAAAVQSLNLASGLVQVVPEPATVAMFSVACALAISQPRRRGRK